MLPDSSAALHRYSQAGCLGAAGHEQCDSVMDRGALKPSDWSGLVLRSCVSTAGSSLWLLPSEMSQADESQEMTLALTYQPCHTSMFLLATFFTTAGNSSDAFFPLAISWNQTANLIHLLRKSLRSCARKGPAMHSRRRPFSWPPVLATPCCSPTSPWDLHSCGVTTRLPTLTVEKTCGVGFNDRLLFHQDWECAVCAASVSGSQITKTGQGRGRRGKAATTPPRQRPHVSSMTAEAALRSHDNQHWLALFQ